MPTMPLLDPATPLPTRQPTTRSLVLFVGEAIRPDAGLASLLARDGVRALALPGIEQAARAAALACFDIVLVDGALVDGPASRALVHLAAEHQCPLVVLGERADEVDEIVSLEMGADLYLARPVATRRLRAHLAALLRRRAAPAALRPLHPAPAAAPAPTVAGWSLDPLRSRLERAGRSVDLTYTQSALLLPLFEAAGRLVPRNRLMAALPHGERLHARSLDVYMHRLRQRLRDHGVDDLQVEAVRGRGYALGQRELAAAA